jgi:hypothetical protein
MILQGIHGDRVDDIDDNDSIGDGMDGRVVWIVLFDSVIIGMFYYHDNRHNIQRLLLWYLPPGGCGFNKCSQSSRLEHIMEFLPLFMS